METENSEKLSSVPHLKVFDVGTEPCLCYGKITPEKWLVYKYGGFHTMRESDGIWVINLIEDSEIKSLAPDHSFGIPYRCPY